MHAYRVRPARSTLRAASSRVRSPRLRVRKKEVVDLPPPLLAGELPRVESTGKKGAPKTPKTPKKGAPASSPNARVFQSESLPLPSGKKEGCDAPKRKWFGIKKKAHANKEARDREKGGTLE